ncbi:SapC family protein [uncultured Sphingomonas sp.]|uniref:SapC family protein n=1 Tax=uncultured Sphingomonas sp. TaxID=158754 RepID=UPI0025E6A56C|nr:SapC family protein [uncultured Sphingomonas sp.]
MASAAQPAMQGLPMLYNDLVPLSSVEHATWKMRPLSDLNMIAQVHAVPLTVEEFPLAQRFFPIVFSSGAEAVPLALMGLNEGVNVFVKDGKFDAGYVPAFLRRYPWLLARLNQDQDELSLCFDPLSGLVGEFEDGLPLFENGQPAQVVTDTLQFCEQFEIAAQATTQFIKELNDLNVLEDGEFSIQHPSMPQPYNYRGFRMVNNDKLRELRGDQLRKMNQNGMLTVLHAHMFSLNLMNDIFGRQWDQGQVPGAIAANGAA